MDAVLYRIGSFSRINDAVSAALRAEFPDLTWRDVDVEREIVDGNPVLKMRALAGVALRYGARIAAHRQPPRDFYPRLPSVLRAVRRWARAHVDPARVAFTFQTQSLFDARRDGVPHFVYTDHTYLANLRYPVPKPLLPVAPAWREMERDLYGGAARIFASSGFAADSLPRDYAVDPGRVECVHSGCNVALPERIDSSRRTGNVILFVGVDWERKGGPELVEAFAKVKAAHPRAELWIAGCAPSVAVEGARVMGRLSAAETADCYARADVFCLPSRMDPSASVLAEAAGFGLPVVATPVGGNSERVRDGETGFLCDAGDLAPKLAALLGDAGLRRRLGEAGRRMVDAQFTWPAVAGKMGAAIRATITR